MDNQEHKQLSNYVYTFDITTRWIDNDMFGHVNNVNYYAFFDSIINQFLIEQGSFNPQMSRQIGFIVDSSCQYFSPVAYPDKLVGAVRVNRIGNSSVEYGVALFKQGQSMASAAGRMTHVFVDRDSHKPSVIEDKMRLAMKRAMIEIKIDDESL
ncbi:MAG: acyl-CoA thioesterase [Colwellia sp.]